METEAKAKVVASVWGAEFLQFLAATASAARNLTNLASLIDATTSAFASVSILILWIPDSNPGEGCLTTASCARRH